MLRAIAKLLKILNSDAEPGPISLGFCFAMVAGFTPLFSLHNLLILLLVLILRINLSAFVLGLGFFTALSYALDPLFDSLGLAVLTAESMKGLWTGLYNQILWRIEHFNNTIVMGSVLTSLVLFIPVFLISNLVIRRYRQHILAWILKSRIMHAFKASKIYHYYQTVTGWGSAD